MIFRKLRISLNKLRHMHLEEANGMNVPSASFSYHLLYIFIKNGKMDGEREYSLERLKHSRGKCGIHAQY